jgi:transglutaminase-like putative cysteine protease
MPPLRVPRFPLHAFALLWLAGPALAQEQPEEEVDLKRLAGEVAGESGSAAETTARLVTWINTTFQWSATDYQKRTMQEIVARRAGNCAELANVLAALLQAKGIRFRWIVEINVQARSPQRQETAAGLVTRQGNRMSVFGLDHNDHVWLEVHDETSKTWVPADPAVGVVGARAWVAARLAFADRPVSPVPAIAGITKTMLVPFAVVVSRRGGATPEDRSKHYLVDEFDALYGGKLAALPSWPEWQEVVARLAPHAAAAFAGDANLHEQRQLIEQVGQVYEQLKQEARQRELAPVPPPK